MIGSSSAEVSPIHVGSVEREESARGDDGGDGGIEELRPGVDAGGRVDESGGGRRGEEGGG